MPSGAGRGEVSHSAARDRQRASGRPVPLSRTTHASQSRSVLSSHARRTSRSSGWKKKTHSMHRKIDSHDGSLRDRWAISWANMLARSSSSSSTRARGGRQTSLRPIATGTATASLTVTRSGRRSPARRAMALASATIPPASTSRRPSMRCVRTRRRTKVHARIRPATSAYVGTAHATMPETSISTLGAAGDAAGAAASAPSASLRSPIATSSPEGIARGSTRAP